MAAAQGAQGAGGFVVAGLMGGRYDRGGIRVWVFGSDANGARGNYV